MRNKISRVLNRVLKSEKDRLGELALIQMLNKGRRFSTNEVETIFEIGANHGQDGNTLRKYYGVKKENVYLFEPHPELANEIRKKYPKFNLFECALSDEIKKTTFNITPVGSENDGVSTLGEKTLLLGTENYTSVEVQVETLDNVMQSAELLGVERIDIMKIDVEGFTYEVLKGGENTLRNKVVMLQIESEVVEAYKGQKLYPEIEVLLKEWGFVEIYRERYVVQVDTVWLKEEYLKKVDGFYKRVE